MTEPTSLRVGTVGTSPVGRFLLERLSLWPGCEPVLLSSEETASLSELKLNGVLFLDGDSLSPEQVNEAFRANLPVGLLPPLDWEPADWQTLTQAANGSWFLLNPHHEDPDFRAALSAIQSEEMGPLAAIKRISWVGELVIPETARHIVSDHWLSQFLWEDLDQLLLLAGETPERVFAAEWSEQPASYCLILRFPSGLVSHLERRRGSAVAWDQGWMLTGPKGGYANGHRHIKTDSGELYEVPIDLPPVDPLAVFDPLKTPTGPAVNEPTARHVFSILSILNAIRQSAASGQVMACE